MPPKAAHVGVARDRIVLWNTDAAGLVSLTDSRSLPHKIVSTYLLGGHIILRAAEIFEADDFLVADATRPGGWLYELHKSGQASLALGHGSTIRERVDWRFRVPGEVVDRGILVTSSEAERFDEVRRRTLTRADALLKAGWVPATEKTSDDDRTPALDDQISIHAALERVGRFYMGADRFPETQFGKWLAKGETVESRGRIYSLIESVWSHETYEPELRFEFIEQTKLATTIASLFATARRYGGTISEVRPMTFAPHALTTRRMKRGLCLELRLAALLPDALRRARVRTDYPEHKAVFEALRDLDAHKFAATLPQYISDDDRRDVSTLIYGRSAGLDGVSLVDFLLAKPARPREQVVALMVNRIQEMEKAASHRTILRNVAIGALIEGIVGVFIKVFIDERIPVAPIPKAVWEYYQQTSEGKRRAVFAGLRSAYSPTAARM